MGSFRYLVCPICRKATAKTDFACPCPHATRLLHPGIGGFIGTKPLTGGYCRHSVRWISVQNRVIRSFSVLAFSFRRYGTPFPAFVPGVSGRREYSRCRVPGGTGGQTAGERPMEVAWSSVSRRTPERSVMRYTPVSGCRKSRLLIFNENVVAKPSDRSPPSKTALITRPRRAPQRGRRPEAVYLSRITTLGFERSWP